MSSVQLLDKTRKIGRLLHNNNSSKVVFNDICAVMQDILESNVLVISRKGKVLGIDNDPHVEVIHELIKDNVGGFIDGMLNERMLSVLSTSIMEGSRPTATGLPSIRISTVPISSRPQSVSVRQAFTAVCSSSERPI